MNKFLIVICSYAFYSFAVISGNSLVLRKAFALSSTPSLENELLDITTVIDQSSILVGQQNSDAVSPQRSKTLEQADRLLNQAREEYQLGVYSDAKKSLELTLSTVRTGDTGEFISPITRVRETSFSILGLIRFKSQRISAPSTGLIRLSEPIEKLYHRVINDLALGNEPEFFGMTQVALYGMIYGIDFSQTTDLATLETVLQSKGASSSTIETILTEVRRNQVGNYLPKFYRDAHTIELDALYLLQKVIVKLNHSSGAELALETAEETRTLESIRSTPAIAYALNNNVQQGNLTDSTIPELAIPESVSVKEIKRIARKENATIVYYSIVSEKDILIWVIQPDQSVNVTSIDITSKGESLESVLRDTLKYASSFVEERGEEETILVESLRTQSRGNQNRIVKQIEQERKLKQLYQLLIAPIEEHLPTESEAKVIFVPHKELFLIPFAALKKPSGDYLIDQFSIRLASSLKYLLRDNRSLQKFPTEKDMLIIGNPKNPTFQDLPGARIEAKAISRLTKSFPFIENQATSSNIFKTFRNAKVIHLATHGLLDIRLPSEDTVLLIHNVEGKSPYVQRIVSNISSPIQGEPVSYSLWPDEDNMGRWHVIKTSGSLPGALVLSDGIFTSQQMLNFRLNADLVVLSACNTAQGIVGESTLLGLPMALGLAGVPQVVVSLWDVPDMSTQKLMLEFYLEMHSQKSDIDVEVALRNAMLKIKSQEQYQDPIYWAGFTVIDVSQ